MSTRQERRRTTYHHGDLRRVLLDAALVLATEGGAAAVSLREVARRAGVSSGAPYHHFADKPALLAALAEQGYAELLLRLEASARRTRTRPREKRLEGLASAYFRFATEQPVHYQLMYLAELADPRRYPDLHQRGQRCLEVTMAVLLQGAGAPDPDEALELAVLLWSAQHGFVSLWNAEAFRRQPRFRRPATLPARLASRLARLAARSG